mmetsp:Transcript_29767/g.83886  ORF Transcript_29767/g.83886 Transcript_29767/m.83886 type:complete len:133 (+) Transcript_29767:81-479(+)
MIYLGAQLSWGQKTHPKQYTGLHGNNPSPSPFFSPPSLWCVPPPCRRLLVSAEGIPFEIFKNVYGHTEGKQALADHELSEHEIVIDDNLGFTKDRTVSRLIEMQSDEYLEQHAEQRAPQLLMALHEKRRQAA